MGYLTGRYRETLSHRRDSEVQPEPETILRFHDHPITIGPDNGAPMIAAPMIEASAAEGRDAGIQEQQRGCWLPVGVVVPPKIDARPRAVLLPSLPVDLPKQGLVLGAVVQLAVALGQYVQQRPVRGSILLSVVWKPSGRVPCRL
jgi:hypothetical protein